MSRLFVGTVLLASLIAFAGCGGGKQSAPTRAYGADSSGARSYTPNYGIGVAKPRSTPAGAHGWLILENHSRMETACLIDGYFNTPFRIGVRDQVAVDPEGSGAIDWVACGGDVSKEGFPGAVAISGLGWEPSGTNITVTFLGDSFTVAAG
jgi:hypothetical protein